MYTIVNVDVKDSLYENELLSQGYRFLDRILEIEIPLTGKEEADDLSAQGIKFIVDDKVLRELEQMEKEADVDDILNYRAGAEYEMQVFG